MVGYPSLPSGRGNDGEFNDNGGCYCVGMFTCEACLSKPYRTPKISKIHVPVEDKKANS